MFRWPEKQIEAWIKRRWQRREPAIVAAQKQFQDCVQQACADSVVRRYGETGTGICDGFSINTETYVQSRMFSSDAAWTGMMKDMLVRCGYPRRAAQRALLLYEWREDEGKDIDTWGNERILYSSDVPLPVRAGRRFVNPCPTWFRRSYPPT